MKSCGKDWVIVRGKAKATDPAIWYCRRPEGHAGPCGHEASLRRGVADGRFKPTIPMVPVTKAPAAVLDQKLDHTCPHCGYGFRDYRRAPDCPRCAQPVAPLCGACEEKTADQLRISVTTPDGELLDQVLVCRSCAARGLDALGLIVGEKGEGR